ncbi:protein phosphatase 2C domain-containing protein [Aliiglaciecola sp. NS0011-25]|uniref:PP2C family protein-serine/threonine phosphatase n=1 Tax=Aliiglaciecola sp. NS0011-25 TaxID=3127654 RepID=UPI00310AF1D2
MSNNRIIFEKSEQAGRDYNQDRYAYHLSDQNNDIFIVVADGVGGTKQGELAAEIIANKSGEFWQTRDNFMHAEDFLNAFAQQCNAAIKQTCEQGISTAATLTALLQFNGELVTAHAGDSRIYQFDQNGKVKQTKDHSLAYAKFLMGEIREDELATHPSQTQLLNCLDGSDSAHCEITHWQLNDGEYFVLCTDGFWEIFDNDEILELVKNDNRDYIFANRMDDTLQVKPSQDNTTVVLCELDKSTAVLTSENKTEAATAAQIQQQTSVSSTAPTSVTNKTVTPSENEIKTVVNWKVIALALVALMLLVLLYFTYRTSIEPCCTDEPQILTEDEFEPSPNDAQVHEDMLKEVGTDSDAKIASDLETEEIENQAEQVLEDVEKSLDQVGSQVANEVTDSIDDAKQAVEESVSEVDKSVDSMEQSPPSSAVKNYVKNVDVEVVASSDEQGNVSGPADLNANLDSAPSLELDIAAGEDPIAKLEDRLTQDGSLSKGSKLSKTDVMKDQYTEIITVQLKVKDTPVYGALLRYQKTSSGIEVISGKVSNLSQVPDSPSHDFATCFKQYQSAQSQQAKTIEKGKSDAVLYIDPASSGYFWLTDIIVQETGQAFDLFLLDASCESLRLVPKHVSR